MDGQGTGLPNVYGNIAREFPSAQRKIPHSASSLEETNVVGGGAVDGETLVGTKRESHEEPRRERIVGEGQSNRKAGRGEWWIDRWEGVGALREGKGGRADPPRAARWCLAPFHFLSGLHFRTGNRCTLTRASVARRAGEAGRLHVVMEPTVVEGFLFYNLNDSDLTRYSQHQECNLR